VTAPLRPNTELVAEAWLAGVEGLSADMVATQLPADVDAWRATGFVTFAVVGGEPSKYTPLRSPVLGIDAYAVSKTSNKPPWYQANQLMELINVACHREYEQTWLTLKTNYLQARVTSAYFLGEPRRVYEDVAGYARYTANLQLHWVAES
jgi:hypothetical protein